MSTGSCAPEHHQVSYRFQTQADKSVSWQVTCETTSAFACGWAPTRERAIIQATAQAEAMLSRLGAYRS